ncbi:MAG: crossover junction endodeoxyribonuclease RuvC [Bacteroidota bacterium]|nr:crossover junction endodeoxyribonuclease RuvC [Bacteroidota bacterium]
MIKDRTILGIDPGSNVMGYGVIKLVSGKPELVAMGVVKTAGMADHYKKLGHIFQRTLHLVDEYKPDEVALEAPFFGKNVQSMLKLGRAQGVAMAAALYRSLPIFEYAPLRVKQAITGMGSASKEQVAFFLQNIFNIRELPKELDATDAVAVAVCHYLQLKNPVADKSFRNWSDFVKKNPDRVK